MNLRGASLIGANLTNATLARAHLSKADLSCAVLKGTSFNGSYCLETNFTKAKLKNAIFRSSKLYEANFNKAKLKGADFRQANLNFIILFNADITGVKLFGAGRDNWKIDGIKCDYVFLDSEGKERIPKNRDFRAGEFEELYRHLPTIEYFFEHGFTPIDAILMNRVVQVINEKHPEFELRLDSFHSRGQPHAVFTLLHKEVAEEALILIKRDYELRIKEIEAQRDVLEKCIIKAIDKPQNYIAYAENVEMGDKYDIKGQAGAVGRGAHSQDINFKQVWNDISKDFDLLKLSEQLSELRAELKKSAKIPEHDTSIGEIAAAEIEVKAGNGSKVLEHLKKAGKWTFDVATKIGTDVAAEVIKKSMGL